MQTYTLIRSNRKTIAIELRPGEIIVRAPVYATKEQIDAHVRSREQWIRKQQEKLHNLPPVEPLSMEEVRALAEQALKTIPPRVAHYARLLGVTYGRITIRNQRTRWGSCSSKGNLNFNCLLMLTPPEVVDSVIIHELCHLKEMNHSDRFYREVLRVYPEYWRWDRWLKENGELIMMRLK